MPMQVSMLNVP